MVINMYNYWKYNTSILYSKMTSYKQPPCWRVYNSLPSRSKVLFDSQWMTSTKTLKDKRMQERNWMYKFYSLWVSCSFKLLESSRLLVFCIKNIWRKNTGSSSLDVLSLIFVLRRQSRFFSRLEKNCPVTRSARLVTKNSSSTIPVFNEKLFRTLHRMTDLITTSRTTLCFFDHAWNSFEKPPITSIFVYVTKSVAYKKSQTGLIICWTITDKAIKFASSLLESKFYMMRFCFLSYHEDVPQGVIRK